MNDLGIRCPALLSTSGFNLRPEAKGRFPEVLRDQPGENIITQTSRGESRQGGSVCHLWWKIDRPMGSPIFPPKVAKRALNPGFRFLKHGDIARRRRCLGQAAPAAFFPAKKKPGSEAASRWGGKRFFFGLSLLFFFFGEVHFAFGICETTFCGLWHVGWKSMA